MSSVAVPKKMVPVPNVYGVESFKEIKPEIVALHPVQHKNTTFYTAAQNRISFRIPAYANALLDNSRSFIHMRLGSTVSTGSTGAYLANGLPIFDRIVVKTSAGLTLEDVSDLDVLRVMMDSLRPAETISQGSLGNGTTGVADYLDTSNIRAGKIPYTGLTPFSGPNTYKEVMFKFDFGIFSKKLTKFLPLFMADGGAGYSFDVDLYLSDKGMSAGNLMIHSPVWYMHLMRMDEGLARRFNQMAVHGEEIRIPFTTWHTHRTSLTSNNIIAYIHENATNFKKILTCLHNTSARLITASGSSIKGNGMLGGINSSTASDAAGVVNSVNTVSSYNYRVGVQHVYNEPVQETSSNTRTLQFVKSAFGYSDDTVLQTELHSTLPNRAIADGKKRMFEAERWCAVASFDYSPGEEGVIQGISTSNPVELSLSVTGFDAAIPTIVLNYCELAYDLVFKGGSIHYEEQKPGSQSVY
jgi:hypothetical protein